MNCLRVITGTGTDPAEPEVYMKRADEEYRRLFLELEEIERQGVLICMNRKPASPCQVADAHTIQEDVCYMRDYIMEGGIVKELHFDRLAELS